MFSNYSTKGDDVAFIPKGAQWYIAQVVIEFKVESQAQNVVHINYLVVRADSPEEAHAKALTLGREHESEYLNSDNKKVEVFFRGLRNLSVVHDDFEHGGELLYEEMIGASQDVVYSLVKPKELLSVFKPIQPSAGSDYGSEEIRREARARQIVVIRLPFLRRRGLLLLRREIANRAVTCWPPWRNSRAPWGSMRSGGVCPPAVLSDGRRL
jgi:hypothetical protein